MILTLLLFNTYSQQNGVEKIIFASFRDSTSHDPSLYMMDLEGNNITRISDKILGDFPRISHDGKRLAYTGWDNPRTANNQNIHVLNIETKEDKNISLFKGGDGKYHPTSNDCVAPSWSPNDSFIVYTEFSHWTPNRIYKVKSDTSTGFERDLLTPHLYDESAADWSPINGKILYATQFYNDSLFSTFNYFTMDADGTNRKRLTNLQQHFGSGIYSHDEKKIAFLYYQQNEFDMYTMNSDGTDTNRITTVGIRWKYVPSLSWSYDDVRIIFSNNEQIYAADVTTKEIKQITSDSYDNYTPIFAVIYPTSIEEPRSTIVDEFDLYQNYPNPFNPKTTIEFRIKNRENVKLSIYDAMGCEITTLISSEKDPGKYKIDFEGSNLSSGVYFYTLTISGKIKTKSMLLLK